MNDETPDKVENEGEEVNQSEEDSSGEDERSSDESDSDSEDLNGGQGVTSPEFFPPVGDNEQSEFFPPVGDNEQSEEVNAVSERFDSNLGIPNAFVSVQVPKKDKGVEIRGGDTGFNHVEANGTHVSLSSSRYLFNMGRPNKGFRRLKPSNDKKSRGSNTSPISGQRPKKRSREDVDFSFDLNKEAVSSWQDTRAGDLPLENCQISAGQSNAVASPVENPPAQIGEGSNSGNAGEAVSKVNE
ncbi:hypothetical protein Hanom_Chr10g00919271 [Helianthus anomalus]